MPKKGLFALFAALSMVSGPALADDKREAAAPSRAVALSDAELDQVVAGFVFVSIFNPGAPVREVPRVNDHRAMCINCGGTSGGGVSGIVITPNGDIKPVGPR